jgi:cytochrome c peroxidase
LQDIRVSPDGKYAVVTHTLARYALPATQLDRGWMHTNAKTIIALDRLEILNTVLLDDVDRGAANPWGVAWSADSRTLVVAHAGTHEVSVIDFGGVLGRLSKLPVTPSAESAADYTQSSHSQADVPNDLSFLVGLRQRIKLPSGDFGPRALVVAGNLAITANYFSDSLTVIDLAQPHAPARSIALGPKPEMNLTQQGEFYFHDAGICFQGWQSCASCHPGDGRVDGLNWDLLNDGIGNPKNTKSLLLAHKTPPAMWTGVRDNAETAVRAGIRHILFTVQPPEVANALDAWLKSLQPVPSPHLVNGKLSAAARRGEKLFRSRTVGCAECHPAPLFTDLKTSPVGTAGPLDQGVEQFDTPSLVEVWRTAPYLHDGSAATIRDVLTARNPNDEHGKTSHLTPAELDDLIAYVLSL